MVEKPLRPHDVEVIERLTRMEQKLDSHISSRPCDKNSERIAAIEKKVWLALGGLAIIGPIVGYIANKLPIIASIAAAGATP